MLKIMFAIRIALTLLFCYILMWCVLILETRRQVLLIDDAAKPIN